MRRFLSLIVLLGAASAASAHTGHDTSSLAAGLVHPLGADHLLAMVAVGVWSVWALPAGRAWQGPLAFMLALFASALLGTSGVQWPYLESAIAASVLLFGLMLALANRRWPAGLGLGLIVAGASLHGLAHGAEAPASASLGSYAAGFLFTTAVLHCGGVLAGLSLRRWLAERATQVLAGLGCALGGAGLYLLSQ